MKKYQLEPFKRNRYFYGKLLTVGDFNTEQEYFNHKRFMANSLIHGSGIVCGLEAVKNRENNRLLDLAPGAALDTLGREIVIDRPQQISIPAYLPFDQVREFKNGDTGIFLLCAEYCESSERESFSIAASDPCCDDGCEYSHIHETYKFSIVHEKSLAASGTLIPWPVTKTVYSKDGIVITRTVPQRVGLGEDFEVRLKISDTGGTWGQNTWTVKESFAGAYEAGSRTPGVTFNFPGNGDDKRTEFEISYRLRAFCTPYCGRVETVTIQRGGTVLELEKDSGSMVDIMELPIPEEPAKTSGNAVPAVESEPMEEACPVYLAVLVLKCVNANTGDFTIEYVNRIPPAPGMYVYGNPLLHSLIHSPDGEPLGNVAPSRITTGTLDFDLKTEGANSYETIDSGLGNGPFSVSLSLESGTGQNIFCGDPDFFRGSDRYKDSFPPVVMGAVSHPKDGTFEIGIRRLSPFPDTRVRVRWWASAVEAEMALSPEATVRKGSTGKITYTPSLGKITGIKVLWNVRSIWNTPGEDQPFTFTDGTFSSGRPGIYRIEAASETDPWKYAVAITVVYTEETKLEPLATEMGRYIKFLEAYLQKALPDREKRIVSRELELCRKQQSYLKSQ